MQKDKRVSRNVDALLRIWKEREQRARPHEKVPLMESWGYDGHAYRFEQMNECFRREGMQTPEEFIRQKAGAGKCAVMVLGPSRGDDLVAAHRRVREAVGKKGKVSFDVFGLRKSLSSEAKNVVRRDYSMPGGTPTPFEVYENPALVGAYDAVVAQMSVGVHTNDPAAALAKAGTLLAPGGKAFVEVSLASSQDGGAGLKRERELVRVLERFWKSKGVGGEFRLTPGPFDEGNRFFVVERESRRMQKEADVVTRKASRYRRTG